MQEYHAEPTLGGYQPVRSPAGGGTGKSAATLGLAAAVLYILGVFVPYYTGGGQSASLSDGGKEVYAIFLLPGAIGIIAALKAMSSGSTTGAGLAAGAAVGMFGVTQFLVVFSYRIVSEAGDFGGGINYGIGFYCHAVASVLALVGVLMGLGLPRSESDETRPLNPALCAIGGIAFIGAGAAILLPENGVSILDIEDGLLKASAIAWAVVSPAAGLFAAVSKVRARVGFAAGVALGHLGMVLGMAMQNANEGSGIGAGFNVSNEGLYNVSVIVSALLVGVALLMNAQEGGSVMTGAVGGVGSAGAARVGASGATASPPQWATDPFGRHQLRYFDGRQWTASVSDNGAVSTDPPVATPAPPTSGFSAPTSGFAAPTSGLAAPTSGLTTPTSGLGLPAASPFDTPSTGAAAPAPAGKQCYMGHENVSSSLYCTTCGARLND